MGISRFAPKGPELAGFAVGAVVSAETNSGVEEISAELSLALKSGCPATETVVKQRRGSNERRLRVEAKHQVLARPFGRHIAQPDNSHSVWKPSINGCLDEVGRKEGERDRHVDLPHTASFAVCDAFGIRSRIGDEFIEPSAPPRNRCDQECAVLGTDRTDVLRRLRIQARESHGVGWMVSYATALRSRWRLFRFRFDPTPIASVSSMTSWSDWTSTRVT